MRGWFHSQRACKAPVVCPDPAFPGGGDLSNSSSLPETQNPPPLLAAQCCVQLCRGEGGAGRGQGPEPWKFPAGSSEPHSKKQQSDAEQAHRKYLARDKWQRGMVKTIYLLKCHTYPALLGTPSEPSVKRGEQGRLPGGGRSTRLLFKKCVFGVVGSAEILAQGLYPLLSPSIPPFANPTHTSFSLSLSPPSLHFCLFLLLPFFSFLNFFLILWLSLSDSLCFPPSLPFFLLCSEICGRPEGPHSSR